MSSANKGSGGPAGEPDRRAERRERHRAANRADILDAAEEVFGEHGPRAGSLRQIAQRSGFSTAGIYLFFENKEDLFAQVLTRRGLELVDLLRGATTGDGPAMDRLHRVVDVTVEFFEARPHFRRLIRHATGGPAIIGPTLATYGTDPAGLFQQAMDLLADVVLAGQRAGEIRAGNAAALAHLFSVLVNEHVLLAVDERAGIAPLTRDQFHDLVDAALRGPRRDT